MSQNNMGQQWETLKQTLGDLGFNTPQPRSSPPSASASRQGKREHGGYWPPSCLYHCMAISDCKGTWEVYSHCVPRRKRENLGNNEPISVTKGKTNMEKKTLIKQCTNSISIRAIQVVQKENQKKFYWSSLGQSGRRFPREVMPVVSLCGWFWEN